MDLLTQEEYKAIAAGLDLPTSAFIDGGFRPAISGRTFETINPATREKLTDISGCAQEDVDFAVLKAREAFDDGRWSKLHPSERKEVLIRALQADDPQCPRVGGHGEPRQRQDHL